MCDIVGQDGNDCADVLRLINLHIFNNRKAITVLQNRFNVLNIEEEREGAWIVSIATHEMQAFVGANAKRIENQMMRGEPFALNLLDKITQTPMGIDWSLACRFITKEEAVQFKDELIEHITKVKKEKSGDGGGEADDETRFSVTASMAPLARIILSDKWEIIQEIMENYEKSTHLNVIAGVMDFQNSEKYSVRNTVVKMVVDNQEDAPCIKYDHTVALLSDHIIETMLTSDKLNNMKERKGAPNVDLGFLDNIISSTFSRIFHLNESLMPPTPISMRRIILSPSTIIAACSVCGKSDAKLRCCGCFFSYYCSKKCQKESWSVPSKEYRLSHKHICKCMRSFALVLAQLPSTIQPMEFKNCADRATAAVNQFCKAIKENKDE